MAAHVGQSLAENGRNRIEHTGRRRVAGLSFCATEQGDAHEASLPGSGRFPPAGSGGFASAVPGASLLWIHGYLQAATPYCHYMAGSLAMGTAPTSNYSLVGEIRPKQDHKEGSHHVPPVRPRPVVPRSGGPGPAYRRTVSAGRPSS